MIKAKTIFFIPILNYIGGMEQWIYYIAKKYSKEHDITLIYKKAAPEQLNRLRKLIKCIEFGNQEIECEKAFFCYNFEGINKIKSKEYILIIHSDYGIRNLNITIPKQITKVYAVSEVAKRGFEKGHKSQMDNLNLKCEVLYNPITLDKPKKILKLVSATRLTYEKGRKRMEQLAESLNDHNIPFEWLVFTDSPKDTNIRGFAYTKPRMDITSHIKAADYLVQLSDTEAYGYSIVESLMLGTPVIVTDLPVLSEIGVKDKENGYILKMDMSNIEEVIKNMCKTDLKGFEYTPVQFDEWEKILGTKTKPKYNYKEEMKMKVEVQVTLNTGFYDIEAGGALREYNKTYEMTRERADFFVEKGWVKILREIPDVKTLAEEVEIPKVKTLETVTDEVIEVQVMGADVGVALAEETKKKTTKKKTTTKKKVTKKK